jgi:hypothetical protein
MADLQVRTDVPGEFLHVHGHALRRQMNQSQLLTLLITALGIACLAILIVIVSRGSDRRHDHDDSSTAASVASTQGVLYLSRYSATVCNNTRWWQESCGTQLITGLGLPEGRVALTSADCVASGVAVQVSFQQQQTFDSQCQRIISLLDGYPGVQQWAGDGVSNPYALVLLQTRVSSATPVPAPTSNVAFVLWVQTLLPAIQSAAK